MIQEAYVSLEVAKLLKEKGFNEPCHSFYEFMNRLYHNDMDKYFPKGMTNSDHDKEGNRGTAAPTHQMACSWLRENKGIHIGILPYDIEDRKDGSIVRYLAEIYTKPMKGHELCVKELNVYDKPEEAVEEALKYTLKNLI